jgi:hypothetical protein
MMHKNQLNFLPRLKTVSGLLVLVILAGASRQSTALARSAAPASVPKSTAAYDPHKRGQYPFLYDAMQAWLGGSPESRGALQIPAQGLYRIKSLKFTGSATVGWANVASPTTITAS